MRLKTPKQTAEVAIVRFQVGISVNFSNILLPDEYLMNPDNYVVSNKAYGLENYQIFRS